MQKIQRFITNFSLKADYAMKTMAAKSIDVYVKLPYGRTSSFQLVECDTVQKIYDRIAKEEAVSVDLIRIKYTGKCLNPSVTVGYMGICAETILKAELITEKQLNIVVKLPDGKTLSPQVKNTSRISEIKRLIASTEDVPSNRIVLKMAGREFTADDMTAMDAGIAEEAVLQMETKEECAATVNARASDSADQENLSEADKQAVMSSFDSDGRPIDVVFSFDTTGSMYSCLDKVRSKLSSIVRRLLQQLRSVRIGLIAHGDYCDYSNYVLRSVDLTSDVDQLVEFVESVPQTGGGDSPECYEWVLRKAQGFDWAEHSAKALVVIGDCEPHASSYTDQHIIWQNELEMLKALGVKVYGVQALNHTAATPFYQELAEATGGAYVQFCNFDIIGEMFLAVCYRESCDQRYQQFCEEVATSSDLTETARQEVTDVLQQLDKQTLSDLDEPNKNKTRRYVAATWWDATIDHDLPQYSYNPKTDTWRPVVRDAVSSFVATTPSTSGSVSITRGKSFLSKFSAQGTASSSRSRSCSMTSSKKSRCSCM